MHDRKTTVLAKSETALLTLEKIKSGTPRRIRWAYVVRLGLASIDGGAPVYTGGVGVFRGAEGELAARRFFTEHSN